MLLLFCSGLVWVYMYVESSGDPVVDSGTGYVTFEKTELLSVSFSVHYGNKMYNGLATSGCSNDYPVSYASSFLQTTLVCNILTVS